jgi:hypothetical protein
LQRRFDAIQATLKDPFEVSVGLIIRLRVKKFKKAFNGLLRDT